MPSSFNWYQFISETGSEIAPAHLFRHVERSIEPNLIAGHTLEVEISQDPKLRAFFPKENMVWPCEILLSNEKSLYLRWCYPNDDMKPESPSDANTLFTEFFDDFERELSSEDCVNSLPFWLPMQEDTWNHIHPVGWARAAGVAWFPPLKSKLTKYSTKIESICHKNWVMTEWEESVARRSVPRIFFEYKGVCFNDLIQINGYLECQLLTDPTCVWPIKVLKNCGGRITVSWMGVDGSFDPTKNSFKCLENFQMTNGESPLFTIFFLNQRIHPLGWGFDRGYTYKPPSDNIESDHLKFDKDFLVSLAPGFPFMKNAPNDGFFFPEQFNFSHEPPKHNLHAGLKLEAFCDSNKIGVCPATVIKILSDRYFVVEVDTIPMGESPPTIQNETFVAHMSMPQIMPPNLGHFHGFQLVPPTNWPIDMLFTWSSYHSFLSNQAQTAPLNSSPTSLESIQTLANFLSVPVHRFFHGHSTKPRTLTSSASDSYLSVRDSESKLWPATQANLDFPGISASKRPATEFGSSTLKDFFVGMKLEMTLPPSLWNRIVSTNRRTKTIEFQEPPNCSATIIRAQAGLIWLLPDLCAGWQEHAINTQGSFDRPVMFECSSTEIYPLGWSKANRYPFIPPMSYVNTPNDNLPANPMWHSPSIPRQPAIMTTGTIDISGIYNKSEHCPPLYINANCYPGPYICKSSFDALASQYGPGPMVRTLQYMLTRLVSCAYKPIRVLRLLEADWATALAHAASPATASAAVLGGVTGALGVVRSRKEEEALAEAAEQRHEGMQVCLVRARCPRRGIKIEAPVEVCSKRRALDEYCRQVSLLLEGCPYLISTRKITPEAPCPARCYCLIRPRTKLSSNFPSSQNLATAAAASTVSSSSLFDSINTDLRLLPRGSYKKAQTVSSLLLDPAQTAPPQLYNWCPVIATPSNSLSSTATVVATATHGAADIAANIPSSESNNGSEDGATNSTSSGGGAATTATLRRSTRTTTRALTAVIKHTMKRRESEGEEEHQETPAVTPTVIDSMDNDDEVPTLSSNPMHWTSADVAAYLESTDCRELWPWLASEAVDGQAFMLLSPPEMLHDLKGLQWESAVKLSRHVLSVKRAFLEQFCRPQSAVCFSNSPSSASTHPPPSI